MKYKLIIFDFDGTLADSYPWFISRFNQVAAKYRFKKIATHEIDGLRYYSAGQLMKYLGVPIWKMPLIANHVRKLMANDIQQIPTFEGVASLLKRLSDRGIAIAMVSSNSYENVRAVLGQEIAALIKYYECGVSVFGKQAKLRKLLKHSGIHPAEIISIGDEIRDIEAAKRVNIDCAAVAWGYTHVTALQSHAPTQVFNSVAEIAEKVL